MIKRVKSCRDSMYYCITDTGLEVIFNILFPLLVSNIVAELILDLLLFVLELMKKIV